MDYIKRIWNSPDLRKKILYTIWMLIIFRIITHISIPGVNVKNIQILFEQSAALSILGTLTGGAIKNFSIALMGMAPYINASIIMQLLTVIVPKLEALSKEGIEGRRVINRWTRYLTVPLAMLQSWGMILLLNQNSQLPLIQNIDDPWVLISTMITVTAGTVLLMWIGELITEKGIGNGISLIIMVGIVSSIPSMFLRDIEVSLNDQDALISTIIFLILLLALTILVVIITEAQREIPIIYTNRRVVGNMSESSYLPIKINQAGMIPMIFAISVILFPNIISSFFLDAKSETIRNIAKFFNTQLSQTSIEYMILYFLLIFAFTYFYVSITFNATQIAENLQKRGGFVPGYRPGKETADYLEIVSYRLTLFGGIFLGFIAIAPLLINTLFEGFALSNITLFISGASLIIIVGVVLELMRQINSQLVMHNYDKLY